MSFHSNYYFSANFIELIYKTLFTDYCYTISGLDVSDCEDDGEEEEDNSTDVNCNDHMRRASWFCVDCSLHICARCYKIHHSTHETVSRSSMNKMVSGML